MFFPLDSAGGSGVGVGVAFAFLALKLVEANDRGGASILLLERVNKQKISLSKDNKVMRFEKSTKEKEKEEEEL